MTSRITDDWPWRIRTSTLVLIVVWVVVAIGLAGWIYVTDNVQLIANVFNLFGAALTFGGLLYAYARASSDFAAWRRRQRASLQRLRARITGRALPVKKGQASGTFRADLDGAGHVEVTLNDSLSMPDLAGFVNRLSANLVNVEADIHKLVRAIEHARAEARAGDAFALAEAGEALRGFDDQLKRSQLLDLRWAIAGVGFSIVGAALNLCT